jgi:ATP-dependent helicase/nuclease subunit A
MSDAAPFTANGSAIPESTFQALALNIQQNVVIEACAGSGKTWLLVARLLKLLLLQGVAPAQIVAITFTRKAAQEMKQRLADMLDELHSGVHTGLDAKGATLLAAMTLPNDAATKSAIEAAWQRCRAQGEWPSIMTFHEWFIELRQNAPLSSLANAGAMLTDDEAALKTQAWQQFWADARDVEPLHDAMQLAVTQLGLNAFETALNAMLERRAEWLVYTQHLASQVQAEGEKTAQPAQLAQAAYTALTQPSSAAQLWHGALALMPRLKAIASLYSASKTPTASKRSEGLYAALERWSDVARPATIGLIQIAVKQLMQPISMADGPVVNTKTYKDMLPRLEASFNGGAEGFEAEIEAVHAALQQLHHQATLLRLLPVHQAALECGDHLIACYQANKHAQRVMDFADLEIDAFTLLNQPRSETESSASTRHILLDEFQDTNPVQWQALQAFVLPLLAESAAGGQAASIFVVGDPKQSIYGFRRADPKLFSYVQRRLHADFGAVLLKTQRTRRNAQSINQWVNAVFVPPNSAQDGLFSTQFTLSTVEGKVGVLPLLTEEDGANGHTEAQQVVHTLLAWKSRNPHLDWSQAMVLARKRDALAAVAAALHGHGVASVSADRGGFFALPEIADVTSLLTALNNPSDGLALLSALRSPLFAVSDSQLSELLANGSDPRQSAPKARWLGIAQLDSEWARSITAWLRSWQSLCTAVPLHDALDAMMHQAQWVQRFAMQAPERASAIAANLAQLLVVALSVNQGRYPSLPRFVQALAALRESDALAAQSIVSSQAVRLSTIHGAKGLEADCVVMVGLYGKDKVQGKINVLLDWPAEQAQPTLFALQLCDPEVLTAAAPLGAAHHSDMQASVLEHDTLLYVAMTRAVSELWISATLKKNPHTVYERMASAYAVAGFAASEAAGAMAEPSPSITLALANPLPPLASQPAPAPRFSPSMQSNEQPTPQALGVLMHNLLEHALRYLTWPSAAALPALALASDVPLEAAQTLLTRCQTMVQALGLLNLAQHVDYLAIEESLVHGGQQLRPDAVAYLAEQQTAWVIDYKYSFSADSELANDYAQQLGSYAGAVESAGFTTVVCSILTLAGECWRLQAGQWVLGRAPWLSL